MTTIEEFIFRLTYCKGLGIVGKWKMVQFAMKFQQMAFSAQEVVEIVGVNNYSQVIKESWQKLTPDFIQEQAAKQKFITFFSEDYPVLLKEIPHPPLILFYEGHIQRLQLPLLAVVGARDASSYGRRLVEQFVPGLVRENYGIISGLAKGIDSYSHHGTIQAEGYTIGVVGTGVDQCYPKEAFPIYSEMKENHLIISEYPKGTGAKKHHFPMRNRIIAGLCQGICVIEAKERSGSLITAQLALENGREVFAFPGDLLNGRSTGCHRLIQDGAKCVVTLADILEELPNFE
ncbi:MULTISPECIES: DNA-processing protein DprA [Enterococcus]|uniref:DNA-processing protein DprA n=1 Tax=Enterococcus TaxID=1350 RepID=UPI00065E96FD|nr:MULTISPECIES: DNA-processing protein DprA [Enterococcus]